MSHENSLTGRNGKFVVGSTQVARCKGWDVAFKLATTSEWGDSDSGGYTNRAAGRRDATFNSSGVYHKTDEVFDLFTPGDHVIATLWMDNVSLYWDFPDAMNIDFNLSVNIDTEEVEAWTSSWGADGIFYRPGQAGAPSRTLPS